MAASKRGTARAVALPVRGRPLGARSLVPSLRSFAVGIGILVFAAGAYVVALETSIFAVRTLAIKGGSPAVQAEVRKALASELGRSLLRIDAADIDRRAAALPDVVSLRFDRAFPNTLRIWIKPERAVLLLRRGSQSWIVSARGRVMRSVSNPRRSALPRLWVPKSTSVSVGATLSRENGALAAAAVAPISKRAFPGGVRTVVEGKAGLTLVMRSGPAIRLGSIGDLRLKLAIAKQIMRVAGSSATTSDYIDVSVPERPVLGSINSQVAGTG